ncbi:type VI secretion system secreted protein VgrG [Brevibacillus sp. IT-7CA2]|uniref:phage baseplate assembly protein V n=1 Tax=Brevibacillus sp. IT-7CA2 TaxID=3026436 RepID=UPI0039DF92AD
MSFDHWFYQDELTEEERAKIHGVIVGIVTNNEDPEKLSRVKLKLPLVDNERETDWVRIATLFAGKDRGSLFIPEVGDEVLVAFHWGDVREPFVIGMLWNQENKGPEMAEKNNIRKITTRAGHEVIFGDDPNDGKITIATKKGQQVELSDKDESIVLTESSGNHQIAIKGGSTNEVTVKSGSSTITLNAKGQVTILSDTSLTIKSTQLNLEAQGAMSIKAGASLNIKSDGIVAVNGSVIKLN